MGTVIAIATVFHVKPDQNLDPPKHSIPGCLAAASFNGFAQLLKIIASEDKNAMWHCYFGNDVEEDCTKIKVLRPLSRCSRRSLSGVPGTRDRAEYQRVQQQTCFPPNTLSPSPERCT